ncbi:uncharacterized protein LOC135809657 [Sycon ciliatum]|uniref:uncharacterized protein LOC135809657 n=1 Tax=Sycon ciliatum TaxID=27933 RepID=UPI0031F67F94
MSTPRETGSQSATSDQTRGWSQSVDRVCLLVIFALATFLRSYRLDDVPTGLYIDEVALTVEARSLGQTGRDVDGNFLPLFPTAQFSAAWGYSGMIYQPIYVYFKVPFELLLSRGVVSSVRLPSVIWGLCGIATGTALCWVMLKGTGVHPQARRLASLAVALLVAISPWHLHFSRLGFEVISCPVFITSGTMLMIAGTVNTRRGTADQAPLLTWAFMIGVAVLTLSAYAYHTARLFAPLLALSFCICFYMTHGKSRSLSQLLSAQALKSLTVTTTVVLITLLPLLGHELTKVQDTDPKALSEWFHRNFIFTSNFDYLKRTSPALKHLAQMSCENETCWSEILLGNQRLAGIYVFLYNYVVYLSPSFLFFNKDVNRRHSMTGTGTLLAPECVLLVSGLYWVLRDALGPTSGKEREPENEDLCHDYRTRLSRFLLMWYALWPLPASLCVQSPHAVRSFVAMPIFELVMGYGISLSASMKLMSGMPDNQPEQTHLKLKPETSKKTDKRPKSTLPRFREWLNSHGHQLVPVLLMLYIIWFVYALAAYQVRFFTSYHEESLKNFNYEAAVESFTDLRQARYYNKSRVLVTQNVDNSFVYIIYAEDIEYQCLHSHAIGDNKTVADHLNAKLARCHLPYEIAFNDVAHDYVMTKDDLLLLDIQTLKRYPEDAHKSLQLVKQWFNYHGVVRLRQVEHLDKDLVSDEDEF